MFHVTTRARAFTYIDTHSGDPQSSRAAALGNSQYRCIVRSYVRLSICLALAGRTLRNNVLFIGFTPVYNELNFYLLQVWRRIYFIYIPG